MAEGKDVKHTWVNGKLYTLGDVVFDYKLAKEVKRILKDKDIDVRIVKVQPPPAWELWGHYKGEEAKPKKAGYTLTTAGRIKANVVMAQAELGQPTSLCYSCKWLIRYADNILVCEQANNPSDRRVRCKYYEQRGDED